MSARFIFDARADFTDPGRKQRVAREVFEKLAPGYDRFTPGLSFFRDRAWKRALVGGLPALAAPACLDLACGTGDVAFLLGGRYPLGHVLGLDITAAMLDIARTRNRFAHVEFRSADMMQTGLSRESFDIVTGGYALRNAPDLARTLTEIRRVLRPGGYGAFLDFSNPPQPFLQRTNRVLLKLWSGAWGLALYGNPRLFTYITASLDAFADRRKLRRLLTDRGLQVTKSKLHFFGLLETIFVRKDPA